MGDLFQIDKPLPSVIVIGKQPLGALVCRIQLRLCRTAIGVRVVLRQPRCHKDGT